ncbi:MAG: PspA/IM30 family protein [Corynebacterium sp.]|nr:PspA/IM30 family protein [Corynebacterium sp.]
MVNPFKKGWKFFTSAADKAIEDNADPDVLIHQAAEESKRQNQAVQEQAAAVIGNKKQLEMQLNRLLKDQANLQEQTKQAIAAADAAAASGDEAAAAKKATAAEVLATQLVAVETQIDQVKAHYEQAAAAAEQAKTQAAQSQAHLQEQLNQVGQLQAQAAQAKMAEMQAPVITESDNPTLDEIREKIERRYADALGAQELTQSTLQAQMTELTSAGTDMKANARLAEIRAQMQSQQAQITAADADSVADADSADADPAADADSADADTDDAAPADDARA